MDARKELLLRSAARMYSLGVDLDGAKEHLRRLVDAGVGYDSPEMAQAVSEYTELKQQWVKLEQDYLELRAEVLQGGDQKL